MSAYVCLLGSAYVAAQRDWHVILVISGPALVRRFDGAKTCICVYFCLHIVVYLAYLFVLQTYMVACIHITHLVHEY